MINYEDAYILLKIQIDIPYDAGDQGKKMIPKETYIKNSYELIESLKIPLNNVIISNEANANRSSLANYIFNYGNKDYADYRNLEVNTSTENDLNITDNQFISKTTYYPAPGQEVDDKFHYIDFKMPIYLKDISEFFKKVDLLKHAEFNVNISFIDKLFVSKRANTKSKIKSCLLYVEEIELHDEDQIKYLKMVNDGYSRSINFLKNVKIFNDKLSNIGENFYIDNVRNADIVYIYIYGILDSNKTGFHFDLPSVKFEETYLEIDNITFEDPITNDMSAYKILKAKSNHSDNFLIVCENFRQYYRIYCFNVSRNVRDDHNNKFMNIVTNMEETACTLYVVFKTLSSVKLEYNKTDGLIVYISQ